jgi:hypothetical protein
MVFLLAGCGCYLLSEFTPRFKPYDLSTGFDGANQAAPEQIILHGRVSGVGQDHGQIGPVDCALPETRHFMRRMAFLPSPAAMAKCSARLVRVLIRTPARKFAQLSYNILINVPAK